MTNTTPITFPRSVQSLSRLFLNGNHAHRRSDSIRAVYPSSVRSYAECHLQTWRFKGKIIGVRASDYRNNSVACLLQDNGDRTLAVFQRLASVLWQHKSPLRFLIRQNPRKGIWTLMQQNSAGSMDAPQPWLGQTMFLLSKGGQRQSPSVKDRLLYFTTVYPTNLINPVEPIQLGPLDDVISEAYRQLDVEDLGQPTAVADQDEDPGEEPEEEEEEENV